MFRADERARIHPMMPPLLRLDTQMLRSAAPPLRVACSRSPFACAKMSSGYLRRTEHRNVAVMPSDFHPSS